MTAVSKCRACGARLYRPWYATGRPPQWCPPCAEKRRRKRAKAAYRRKYPAPVTRTHMRHDDQVDALLEALARGR